LRANGGKPIRHELLFIQTDRGFPPFALMSVNPVISSRHVQETDLKKIGFFDPFSVEPYKKRKEESDG
jgi:hypothetical protein